jgi:hypothetical protein
MSKLSKLPKLGDSRSAAAFASFDSFDRGGGDAQGRTNPCVQCHTNPLLGALTRCGGCVRVAAEANLQTPQAAESRVATRKSAREAELTTKPVRCAGDKGSEAVAK